MEIEFVYFFCFMVKVVVEEMEFEIERLLFGWYLDVGGIEQEMLRRFVLSYDFVEVGGKLYFWVEVRDGEMENWSRFVYCLYWSYFFFVGEIGIGYFFGCEFDFIVCLRKILFLVQGCVNYYVMFVVMLMCFVFVWVINFKLIFNLSFG